MGIGNIGVSGWIIILVIVILLFGAKNETCQRCW